MEPRFPENMERARPGNVNLGVSSVRAYYLSSGCYNKVSWIRCLINNRSLFLTVLEFGKYKMKALANSFSGGDLFSGS